MANTCFEGLPVELLEEIMWWFWLGPMNQEERMQFMVSSALVCKTWRSIFLRVSLIHVHFPCASYFDVFRRMIRRCHGQESGSNATTNSPRTVDICKSWSLSIVKKPIDSEILDVSLVPAIATAFSALAAELSRDDIRFPNLRRLSLEYVNVGWDDLVLGDRLRHIPDSVTDLELAYSFSPNLSRHVFFHLGMRNGCLKNKPRNRYPSVRRLTLVRASVTHARDMMDACPNALNLTCYHDVTWLSGTQKNLLRHSNSRDIITLNLGVEA